MRCLSGVSLFFILGFFLFPTIAESMDSNRYEVLHSGSPFTPVAGDYSEGLAELAGSADPTGLHMWVQVEELGNKAWRESMAQEGVQLLDYVPRNAWIAKVSPTLTASDLRRLGVRWLGALRLEDKVSSHILLNEEAPWAEYEEGAVIYTVTFHKDVTETAAGAVLQAYPHLASDRIEALNTQVIALNPDQVEALAMEDAVKWVSLLPPPLGELNDGIREAVQVNDAHQPPYNLDGTGSNVLVYDAGPVDSSHPDFSPNRCIVGEGGSPASHATHVGGTVAGNGTNNSNYKGMAPNAKVITYTYESCNPNCLYNSPQDIEFNYAEGLLNYGAQLATNSLGSNIAINGYPCSWEGDYELTAQLLDAIAYGDWTAGIPFLSLWAAGNERAYGTCGTTYNTVGAPGASKNAIVVGATNSNDHSMTYFSSWGPVDDGRIRPDICAPGCQTGGDGGITSTAPGGGYSVKCGTSMATPAMAGIMALVLEELRHSPTGMPNIFPATLKALAINTAQDYGNTGPDYEFGFGEVRTTQIIDQLRNRGYIQSAMDHGDEFTYVFQVPAGESLLRASIVWSDVPGETFASVVLVNDLDIWFEDPQGGQHFPYILNPSSPSSAATRGEDHRNNVEQIEVSNPEDGLWTLHVVGGDVPEGPQKFSIVTNQRFAGQNIASAGDELFHRTGRILNARNQPNPFQPSTTIRFSLAKDEENVGLYVYDAAGRLVRTLASGPMPAGSKNILWDGEDASGRRVSSGVYFYRIQVADQTVTRSMVRLN
ncbi:MAG: S8 family serine peptidase [Candidatus Eisenbacteria bacterium]|uniref:S8 family serine peptidase n=1 Tax=Eiseniibacteriota bacterium TaxID=2212470 RepID=A0A948RYY1_UNCEI|nr:S8 family serine peptidase [Candidatus Eisenbacteria bacterium]MBU1949468.1 S8 family serine peptidase [Candidatus Eisenbacteria bacterium]MBU2692144.1 S8 family serine peptidase [Candidatus Eisenbacteria bacterium]